METCGIRPGGFISGLLAYYDPAFTNKQINIFFCRQFGRLKHYYGYIKFNNPQEFQVL